MVAKPARKSVAIVVPPSAQSLDVSGPLDAFLEANRQSSGGGLYDVRLIATGVSRNIKAGGMSLVADSSIVDEDHLSLDLTLDSLANRVAMSVRNFTRVFQGETGTTPADFVEMARVDAARRLLEESETPLQRVASRCGFASPDTMRRAFLRRIGTGPSDYRERFRR
jgi:transcriptional regulator GlxA family with amidase domain